MPVAWILWGFYFSLYVACIFPATLTLARHWPKAQHLWLKELIMGTAFLMG